MRFKDKNERTTHKACRNCIYKQGIRCLNGGYDGSYCDIGECNNQYNNDLPYDESDRIAIAHSKNNWKRMHRQQVIKDSLEKEKHNREFDSWWRFLNKEVK